MKDPLKRWRGRSTDGSKLTEAVVVEKRTLQQQEQERKHRVRPRRGEEHDTIRMSHLLHPFRADFNDHFETSMGALRDVAVVVNELRKLVRPSAPEEFTVYDPYYCAGSVVRHWRALGVERVVHANRDFYKDIADGTVPREYDMLVTNPPFSDDHIERLFAYLVSAKKPFAFLVPDYTATKPWYKAAVRRHFTPAPPSGKGNINAPCRNGPLTPGTLALQPPPFVKMEKTIATDVQGDSNSSGGAGGGGGGENLSIGTEPFYLIPRGRYDFTHVKGAGNEHSHFRSMWFLWTGRRTSEVIRGASVVFARMRNEPGQQRAMPPEIIHGLDALAEGQWLQMGSRPNPKRREKHRQQARN